MPNFTVLIIKLSMKVYIRFSTGYFGRLIYHYYLVTALIGGRASARAV
jgi:hypothetical protein